MAIIFFFVYEVAPSSSPCMDENATMLT